LDNNIFTKRSIEVHGNLYDYSFVDYKSIKDRVDIICKKHGIFSQIASDHLRGSGCPKCNTSKGERYIIDYLLNNNINFLYQYKFEKCKNKKILIYDFFIPELNICIEFDGIQHYIPIDFFGGVDGFESLKINDDIKNNFCIENGIELYRIPYWSIGDINNIMDLIFFG
jgi:very-short-patch-repair endonuclease